NHVPGICALRRRLRGRRRSRIQSRFKEKGSNSIDPNANSEPGNVRALTAKLEQIEANRRGLPCVAYAPGSVSRSITRASILFYRMTAYPATRIVCAAGRALHVM